MAKRKALGTAGSGALDLVTKAGKTRARAAGAKAAESATARERGDVAHSFRFPVELLRRLKYACLDIDEGLGEFVAKAVEDRLTALAKEGRIRNAK